MINKHDIDSWWSFLCHYTLDRLFGITSTSPFLCTVWWWSCLFRCKCCMFWYRHNCQHHFLYNEDIFIIWSWRFRYSYLCICLLDSLPAWYSKWVPCFLFSCYLLHRTCQTSHRMDHDGVPNSVSILLLRINHIYVFYLCQIKLRRRYLFLQINLERLRLYLNLDDIFEIIF